MFTISNTLCNSYNCIRVQKIEVCGKIINGMNRYSDVLICIIYIKNIYLKQLSSYHVVCFHMFGLCVTCHIYQNDIIKYKSFKKVKTKHHKHSMFISNLPLIFWLQFMLFPKISGSMHSFGISTRHFLWKNCCLLHTWQKVVTN